MTLRGGYNIRLAGRPSAAVEVLPEPGRLHLPLASRRFSFSEVCVQEGERVSPGHVLARDPDNHGVPLLAPRAGTVRLDAAAHHVVLDEVHQATEEAYGPDEETAHAPKGLGSTGVTRDRLVRLGAWQFFYDAHTGALPDPSGVPRAIIVSMVHLEPFVARGDVQIYKRLSSFLRGLAHLQSLLEYQPMYLVLPDVRSTFGARVREKLRGCAWVKTVAIPRRYPYDNYEILARGLGFRPVPGEPVWALDTAAVLAVDRALTLSLPSTVRILSIGGPGVTSPRHLRAMAGYPLHDILKPRVVPGSVRVLNGGGLTGQGLAPGQLGLDAECSGLTVLVEHTDREFLAFLRPGGDRRSYSRCFLSTVRRAFSERLTTALRGERRACVSCAYCEEVCPAGIMPHLIHKYLHQDGLEEAEAAGTGRCVGCGLCSFVCPSKIDLRRQLLDAQETIRRELHPEPVEVSG